MVELGIGLMKVSLKGYYTFHIEKKEHLGNQKKTILGDSTLRENQI